MVTLKAYQALLCLLHCNTTSVALKLRTEASILGKHLQAQVDRAQLNPQSASLPQLLVPKGQVQVPKALS